MLTSKVTGMITGLRRLVMLNILLTTLVVMNPKCHKSAILFGAVQRPRPGNESFVLPAKSFPTSSIDTFLALKIHDNPCQSWYPEHSSERRDR